MLVLATFPFVAQAQVPIQNGTYTLHPVSYTTTQGGDGGQPVGNLQTMNESGLANDWNNYVEFYAQYAKTSYAGTRAYKVPSGNPALSTLSGIQVQANYLGPNTATQIWTWKIYDYAKGAFVTIGDNTFAPSWGSWKVLNFNVPGNPANYVDSGGNMQVSLSSNNAADNVNIDIESVILTYGSVPASSQFLYVSTSGADTNSGTSTAAPLRTISRAVSLASAGTTVYVMGGVYQEQVVVNQSGSASKGYIRIQSFPGQTATLDGTGVTLTNQVSKGPSGLFYIRNQSYIAIEGFEIRNVKPTTNVFAAGISVGGAGSNIVLRDNSIHDIVNAGINTGAHGIGVYGDGSGALTNVTVDGNALFNMQLGYSEAMHIDGNVSTWVVTNNQVHDNNNIGIDALGFYGTAATGTDQATGGSIVGNLVYNSSDAPAANPSYKASGATNGSAAGIYVDGGAQILIEDNITHDNDIGIGLASEHSGRLSSYVTARNNVIFHNTEPGISLGGGGTGNGSADHCVVLNNSLFGNETAQDGLGEINLQYFPSSVSGNYVENNIISSNAQGRLITSWVGTPVATLDYNLYNVPSGTAPFWGWNSTGYSTLQSWTQATGQDAHSLLADPKFVQTTYQPPNLYPNSGSPAIGKGNNATFNSNQGVGTQDFNGHPRVVGALDIGAYEQ